MGDGSAEITITHNGEAEHRAVLARTLSGARRIMHGDVPKRNGQYMTTAEIRNYACECMLISQDTLTLTYIQGGVSYVREALCA